MESTAANILSYYFQVFLEDLYVQFKFERAAKKVARKSGVFFLQKCFLPTCNTVYQTFWGEYFYFLIALKSA